MNSSKHFENQKQKRNRDAISPDMSSAFHVKLQQLTGAKTIAIEFTKDEVFELNDAINEIVGRMLRDGQTPQEINYHSLARLETAWLRITVAIHGTATTPGMARILPLIAIAIDNPKKLIEPTRG